MKEKRDSSDYLRDVLDAIDKIARFTRGMGFDQFASDEKTQFAVVRAMEIVGEASKQIPRAARSRHTEVPWTKMAGMRDKLIHGYFGVDLEIVWETATQLIPTLKPLLTKALEGEIRRKGDKSR
jgi:uncharacterized protein with HEPN domain